MTTDFVSPILDIVDHYGLVAIFILLILDGAMLLPVFPGELLMIIAVMRFADDIPSLTLIVILATVAATIGSLALYGVARGGGRKLAIKHPRLFLMSPETRDKLERAFQRPAGQSMVLFGRLIPFTRLLVNLPAGLARMPFLRFLILTLIGNFLFHAGLMYLAFESRQPDSPVASRAAQLQAAYGNAAWDYVQTNWVIVAAAGIGFGLLLSIRSTIRNTRRPDKPYKGSLLGALATLLLYWGGIAVLLGLWLNPNLLYETIARSGYDLRTMAFGVPYEPLSVVAGAAGTALLLGFLLSSLSRRAKKIKAARRPTPQFIPVPEARPAAPPRPPAPRPPQQR